MELLYWLYYVESETELLVYILSNLTVRFISVLQSLDQDARRELTTLKLRAKAAKFAKATVKTQMASFKVILKLIYI